MIRLFPHTRRVTLETLVALLPSAAHLWLHLAQTYRELNRLDSATHAIERATALLAQDAPNYRKMMARCCVEQALVSAQGGAPSRAVVCYQQALWLTPESPEVAFLLANTLYSQDDFHRARFGYEAAVALDPSHQRAWFNLGHTMKALGHYDHAISCFERVMALNTRFVKARFMRAHVLCLVGRDDEAVAEYLRTLRQAPRYVKAHYNLANCRLKSGEWLSAVRSYKTALRLDPTYDKAWHALGRAYELTQDFGAAKHAYSRALTLRPDLHGCRLQLAHLLDKMGDTATAALHYRVYRRDASARTDCATTPMNARQTLRQRPKLARSQR